MGSMADSLNLDMRSVYPGSQGSTAGQQMNTTKEKALVPTVSAETASRTQTNPLVWWGLLIALFVGLMFVGKQVGGVEPFSNVKMSFYNVVIIGLCSLLFISGAKAVAIRHKGNGLADMVLAA